MFTIFRHHKGFTLVETLVGVFLFALIAMAAYGGFVRVLQGLTLIKVKTAATDLANEQFEIVRNLPYDTVGTIGGVVSGPVPQSQVLTRDGFPFTVDVDVRSIDDPFDGTIGGNPNDTSPADYKLIEVRVSCSSCRNFSPIVYSGRVGPKNLEAVSTNGSLFVHVINANGQPVSGATVEVRNTLLVPNIDYTSTTDVGGTLELVSIPPSNEGYQIFVSKNGYTSAQTYTRGVNGNTNPTKPNATVVSQQLTEITLQIDLVSTLNLSTVNQVCTPIGNISYHLVGTKQIGNNPVIYKVDLTASTNGGGDSNQANLDWDNYGLTINSNTYTIAGVIPQLSVQLSPGATQAITLVLASKNPRNLLVTVKDTNNLPLANADVTITQDADSSTLTTARGVLDQSDWSGGSGAQTLVIGGNQYYAQDGHIDTTSTPGVLTLSQSLGQYQSSGYLESATFDTGSASTFYQLSWQPQNQPIQTGTDSVKFQVAAANTNTGATVWNFTGPDGTAGTYYTLASRDLNAALNNNRYFRYRVFLSTNDINYTPSVSDISFTFASLCVPQGQVLFGGLGSDDVTVNISKTGYQPWSNIIPMSSNSVQVEATLTP